MNTSKANAAFGFESLKLAALVTQHCELLSAVIALDLTLLQRRVLACATDPYHCRTVRAACPKRAVKAGDSAAAVAAVPRVDAKPTATPSSRAAARPCRRGVAAGDRGTILRDYLEKLSREERVPLGVSQDMERLRQQI